MPFRIKLSFGAPSFVTLSLLNMICNVYLITFYERLGTSLSEIAFFTVLARCIDVLSDPCMAQISGARTPSPLRLRESHRLLACAGRL